jgi:hypothetical protein
VLVLRIKSAFHMLSALALVSLAACSEQQSAPVSEASPPAPQAQAQNDAAPVAQHAAPRESVKLMHVHGLTYSPEGKYIYIPSHLGLAVYDHQSWSIAPGYMHDYMGFVGTKDAFYTSGHPAMGSGFVNPFGLMKSVNGGQTWEKLGLEGEIDFHHVTAGYHTNAIYVFNPSPNSKMKSPGLHATFDDGKTWQKADAEGLDSNPFTLAAHPDVADKVAIGGKGGLYLSDDAGNTFGKAVATGPVTAVHYDLDGNRVWFATNDGSARLHVYDAASKQASEVNMPGAEKGPVGYIAQNPADRKEYAIATFGRSVYLTRDEGQTWKAIAREGETISQ